jgi:hypothetical protein
MYINKGIKDLDMYYTNPTVYYDLYSDLITTTTIIGYPSNAHIVGIQDDLVAMYLFFHTDKFTINTFLVSFPEKFPQCSPFDKTLRALTKPPNYDKI